MDMDLRQKWDVTLACGRKGSDSLGARISSPLSASADTLRHWAAKIRKIL